MGDIIIIIKVIIYILYKYFLPRKNYRILLRNKESHNELSVHKYCFKISLKQQHIYKERNEIGRENGLAITTVFLSDIYDFK